MVEDCQFAQEVASRATRRRRRRVGKNVQAQSSEPTSFRCLSSAEALKGKIQNAGRGVGISTWQVSLQGKKMLLDREAASKTGENCGHMFFPRPRLQKTLPSPYEAHPTGAKGDATYLPSIDVSNKVILLGHNTYRYST